MTEETRTPQVGDAVIMEGFARVIVEINGRTVNFDNPPNRPRQVFVRNEDGTTKLDAEGKKVVESGYPSLAGAVGMSNLDLIMETPAVIWGVRGRVDAKRRAPNAVELQPAVHKINERKAG